jgi:hypothetical protein
VEIIGLSKNLEKSATFDVFLMFQNLKKATVSDQDPWV